MFWSCIFFLTLNKYEFLCVPYVFLFFLLKSSLFLFSVFWFCNIFSFHYGKKGFTNYFLYVDVFLYLFVFVLCSILCNLFIFLSHCLFNVSSCIFLVHFIVGQKKKLFRSMWFLDFSIYIYVFFLFHFGLNGGRKYSFCKTFVFMTKVS